MPEEITAATPSKWVYLFWAAFVASLILVLGTLGLEGQLKARPDLVEGDPHFMGILNVLRKIGWGLLAFCALAVVTGMQRLPGYGARDRGGED